ncbi:hypothetical protein CRUP_004927 [Coryphaenoides rupestris]|nr:hypothetical protein CRUP_004927 [Coryphaenoides rupestris]
MQIAGADPDREGMSSDTCECSNVQTVPRSEVGVGTGESRRESSEGPPDARGTDAAPPSDVMENGKYLSDGGSTERPITSMGSRLLGHTETEGVEQAEEAEASPEVEEEEEEEEEEVGETERSARHGLGGGSVVEGELGGGEGGSETSEGGVTEQATAGFPSNPKPRLESVSEPELVWKPRLPEPDPDVSPRTSMSAAEEDEETEWCGGDSGAPPTTANGDEWEEPAALHMNGGGVDREKAQHLAQRLYRLEGVQRVNVVQHMDKEGFLREVVLIGESQERERVLQHFSSRFHQCNPECSSSSGSVLTLTCAMMLLNTDLHGQNVGKAMTTSGFVSNMDGMNDGENFNKDLLKQHHHHHPPPPQPTPPPPPPPSPPLATPPPPPPPPTTATNITTTTTTSHHHQPRLHCVFKQGFLQRKAHADIDGKRTPWGKRSWKTFYGVLKGLVLYLQKVQGGDELVDQPH